MVSRLAAGLDDSDMAEPKVCGDELAGDAGVFWRAEEAYEAGDVGEGG